MAGRFEISIKKFVSRHRSCQVFFVKFAANGLLKTASPILTKVKLGVMQSVINQLISHVAGLAPKVR
jgi:hypothetical protein